MENFQVVAYKSKKGGKFYLTLICIFVLILFPIINQMVKSTF